MRTMLGLRPYSLGQIREDFPKAAEADLRDLAGLQSRVDAVYAAGLLLPPGARGPLVARAQELRTEMGLLQETFQQPFRVLEYETGHARLATLPDDVAELETALGWIGEAAYRTRGGAIVSPDGASTGTNLAKVGLGIGALGAIGLGIWAGLS